MKMLLRILYGLLLAIVFVCEGIADSSDERSLRPTFSVSSFKKVYDASEPVILTLTLGLTGEPENSEHWVGRQGARRQKAKPAGGITVATFEAGTIDVAFAGRDGHLIVPILTTARFEDDSGLLQLASLTRISPGEHVTIPFNVPFVANRGSKLIVEQIVPESDTLAFIYSLAEPGKYTLQLFYHYTGPSNGMPNVFRDRIGSNPVSFIVR
jgi:hypothetical protein